MNAANIQKFAYVGTSILCIGTSDVIVGEIILPTTKYTNSDQMCFRSELRKSSDNVEGRDRV